MSKKSSFVWEYFTVCPSDNSRATCNFCNINISRGGTSVRGYTTTNLSRHLLTFHSKEIGNKSHEDTTHKSQVFPPGVTADIGLGLSKESSPSTSTPTSSTSATESRQSALLRKTVYQPSISEMFLKKAELPAISPKAVKITRLIGEMICRDLQPFRLVEDIGKYL